MSDLAPLQVSINDAAKLLGCARQTLYRMESAGEIQFTKLRGRTLVPMSELTRLSQPATREPVGEPVGKPKFLIVRKRKLSPRLK